MAAYRAYIRVLAGDNGKPLGAKGLEPLAETLSAYAKAICEEDHPDWLILYDPFYVGTHLGRPTIVMVTYSAWETRAAVKAARRFLSRTGWKYDFDLNANTFRAL